MTDKEALQQNEEYKQAELLPIRSASGSFSEVFTKKSDPRKDHP